MATEDVQRGADSRDEPGLVSVIIIFLDEERFLGESIESVLTQDYPSWELLLVDDGSTDGSPDVARTYAERDPRIRYLTHPGRENRGMSASRNLGLRESRGEYVAFLDADDTYMPDRLSRHVAVLAAHPGIGMTGSGYIRWFADGSPGSRVREHARPFVAAGDLVWQPPTGLTIVTSVPYLNMGTCSLTVRRRVALEAGGFEDSFRGLYEDQVFASKILARYPVYVLQAYLARYRHHAGSWTRRAKAPRASPADEGHAHSARFADWLLGYLEQHGIDDPLLMQAVRDRQRREAAPPRLLDRVRRRVGGGVKGMLERALPRDWYTRLLVLDYELDGRRARRAYERLARVLSERALADVRQRSRLT